MDPSSLAAQYSTAANLAARIELHRRCSTNSYGFQRWVFDRLDLRPGQTVLEIACGTGNLWRENLDRVPPRLRLHLSDFSMSMIVTTRNVVADATFVNCAMPELPFASGTFDRVIANHMLYHVDDRERGLAELRRVLRRGGSLFAATNGETHLFELKKLMREYGIESADISAPFTLENGEAQLRRVFDDIRRDDYADALRVTEPELVLGYIASFGEQARAIVAARGDEMRAAIESRIERDGAFHVIKSTGAFLVRGM